MSRPKDYDRGFDELVDKYNKWIASLEDPKVWKRDKWRAFILGMGSILDIFENSPINPSLFNHPLYSRRDLTPEQKDAIALASDLKRVDRTLDKTLSRDSSLKDFFVEDTLGESWLIHQMYGHFRKVYVDNAIR